MNDYRFGSSNGLLAAELSASWRASGFWELGLFGGLASGSYTIDDRARGNDPSLGKINVDANARYTQGILGVRARMHLVRAKKLDGWLGVDFGGLGESWRFTGPQQFKYGGGGIAFAIGFGADYALSDKWALGLGMRFLQAGLTDPKRSDCTGEKIQPGNRDYCDAGFLPGEGASGDPQSTSRGFFELGLRLVYVIPTGGSDKKPAPAPKPAEPARPVTASHGSPLF
jgi:hypothetical protein